MLCTGFNGVDLGPEYVSLLERCLVCELASSIKVYTIPIINTLHANYYMWCISLPQAMFRA